MTKKTKKKQHEYHVKKRHKFPNISNYTTLKIIVNTLALISIF